MYEVLSFCIYCTEILPNSIVATVLVCVLFDTILTAFVVLAGASFCVFGKTIHFRYRWMTS